MERGAGRPGGPPKAEILAPFERGRAHGGSQRTTAMAERLEERRITISWRTIARRETSRASKARSALALRPALVDLYPRAIGSAGREAPAAAIAAHSYLAPQLEA